MKALTDLLDTLPVATLVHLIVTVVLGVDLLVDGQLSSDAALYLGLVEGGNGLLAVGRGISKRGPETTNVLGTVETLRPVE